MSRDDLSVLPGMQLTNHPPNAENPVVSTRLELLECRAPAGLKAVTTLIFPGMGSAPSARSIPKAGPPR